MQSGEEGTSSCNENVSKTTNKTIEEKNIKVSTTNDVLSKPTEVDSKKSKNSPKNSHIKSDNVILHPQWLKPQNSSENVPISQNENEEQKKNIQHKSLIKNKSPNSDSLLIANKSSNISGFSRILQWDPWNKIGRNKNKKDKSKKKENKHKMTVNHDTGDGPKTPNPEVKTNEEPTNELNPYNETPESSDVKNLEYDSKEDYNLNFKPQKIRKIVRFHADVKVVHYINDEVLGHTTEPLKKELEQQERNKELRKEFSPESGFGLKHSIKKATSDYMSSWYKK